MAKTPRTWTGARTPSGLKRVRQASRRHDVLGPRRSAAKTYVAKALTVAANPADAEAATAALIDALSALDRAAKAGAIHPNAAARRKSRLTRKVNAALGGVHGPDVGRPSRRPARPPRRRPPRPGSPPASRSRPRAPRPPPARPAPRSARPPAPRPPPRPPRRPQRPPLRRGTGQAVQAAAKPAAKATTTTKAATEGRGQDHDPKAAATSKAAAKTTTRKPAEERRSRANCRPDRPGHRPGRRHARCLALTRSTSRGPRARPLGVA